MRTPRFTRRHLLKSAGAMAAGAVLLRAGDGTALHPSGVSAASASPAAGPAVLAGVVERTTPAEVFHIRSTAGSKALRLAETATSSRGRAGRTPGAATFVPGDEIVAVGQWTGQVFVASTMVTMFRPVEAHVVGRQGDRLQTTAGAIRLRPDSTPLDEEALAAKPLAQIATGDDIVGTTWRDASSGLLAASRLGVRKGA